MERERYERNTIRVFQAAEQEAQTSQRQKAVKERLRSEARHQTCSCLTLTVVSEPQAPNLQPRQTLNPEPLQIPKLKSTTASGCVHGGSRNCATTSRRWGVYRLAGESDSGFRLTGSARKQTYWPDPRLADRQTKDKATRGRSPGRDPRAAKSHAAPRARSRTARAVGAKGTRSFRQSGLGFRSLGLGFGFK